MALGDGTGVRPLVVADDLDFANSPLPSRPTAPTTFNQEAADLGWGSYEAAQPQKLDAPVPRGTSEQVRARVAERSAQKQALLSGQGGEVTRGVIGVQEGNDIGDEQFWQDMETGSYAENVAKYGKEIADNQHLYIEERERVEGIQRSSRDSGERWGDAAAIAGSELVEGIGGAASIIGGLANDQIGVGAAQITSGLAGALRDMTSDEQRARAPLNAIQDTLDSEDNDRIRDREVAAGEEEWKAGLRNIGRNFFDRLENVVTDPTRLFEAGAEFGGEVAGGFGAAALLRRGGEGAAILSRRMSNAAGIGMTEGGDAYVGAATEVLQMSEEQLMEGSPDYRAMRADGMSHQDALVAAAGKAGMIAAGIAVPLAGATGATIGKMGGRALSRRAGDESRAADLIQSTALEFGEEAVSEGGQSFGQNVGVRAAADENKDLTEGVGEGAAQGAVGGAVGAAATRAGVTAIVAPVEAAEAAGRAVANGAKAVGTAVRPAAEAAIKKIGEATEALRERESFLGETGTAAVERVKTAFQNIDFPALIQETLGSQPVQDMKVGIQRGIQKIQELAGEGNIEALRELGTKGSEALTSLKEKTLTALETATSAETKTTVEGAVDTVKTAVDSATPAIKTALEATKTFATEAVTKVGEAIDSVQKWGDNKKADAHIRGQLRNMWNEAGVEDRVGLLTAQGFDQEDIDGSGEVEWDSLSPGVKNVLFNKIKEGSRQQQSAVEPLEQKVVDDVVAQVANDPEAIKSPEVQAVLQQAAADPKYKEAAQKLQDALIQQASEKAVSEAAGGVRSQIATQGNQNNQMASLTQRAENVTTALRGNKIIKAREELDKIRGLARTFSEKKKALLASKEQGGAPVPYGRQTPIGWANAGEKGATATLEWKSDNQGNALLKAIEADEKASNDFYNTLTQIFPELRDEEDENTGDIGDYDQEYTPPDWEAMDDADSTSEDDNGDDQSEETEETGSEGGEGEDEDPDAFRKEEEAKAAAKNLWQKFRHLNPGDVEFSDVKAALEGNTDNLYEFSPLDEMVEVRAWEVIDKLEDNIRTDLGKFLFALGSMKDKTNPLGKYAAMCFYALPSVMLDENYVQRLLTSADGLGGRKFALIMGHELGHAVDEWARGDIPRAPSDHVELNPGGSIYKEFFALRNHPEHSWLGFDYIKSYEDNGDTRALGAEIFAEMFGLYTLDPTAMQKVMPNGAIFLKNVLKQANANYAELHGQSAQDQSYGQEGTTPQTPQGEANVGTPTPKVALPPAPEKPEQRWSDLLKSGKAAISRFLKAYKFNKVNPSRWINWANPMGVLSMALMDHDQLASIAGNTKILKGIGGEQLSLLRELSTDVHGHFTAMMNERLNKGINTPGGNGKDQRTILDFFKEGEKDITGIRRSRTTAFVSSTAEGNWSYNQDILNGVVLAGIDWLLNGTDPDRYNVDLSDDEVAKVFRTNVDDPMLPEMREAMLSGTHMPSAAHALARKMQSFLGLEDAEDAPTSDTQGMFLALALEFIQMAAEQKSLIIHTNDHVNSTGYNTVQFDLSTRDEKGRKVKGQSWDAWRDTLRAAPNFFERFFIPNTENQKFIGEPPARESKTQMKNKQNATTDQEVRVLKEVQKIEHRVNTGMVDMMNGMGKGLWTRLLGAKDINDSDIYNQEHLESIKGKNRSLEDGWDNTMAYVSNVKEYAEETGMALERVPFFFRYGITKVGRLQQIGFGPQADKTAREVLTATNAVLDLSKPEHQEAFWLSVAQSIGVKTEQQYRAKSIDEAITKFSKSPLNDAVVLIQALQSRGSGATFTAQEAAQFEALLANQGMSAKALHAIYAVAKYRTAEKNMENSDDWYGFEHSLAIEADGKTDGPINAMVNFLSGKFKIEQIKQLAMGGMFFGEKNKTLNEYYETDPNKLDLYTKAANILQDKLVSARAKMTGKVAESYDDVITVLGIVGHVTFDGTNLVVKRNQTKNPLTVQVYGSGVKGIAAKILNGNTAVPGVLDGYYKGMSKLAELRKTNPKATLDDVWGKDIGNKIGAAMQRLTGVSVNETRNGLKLESNGAGPLSWDDPVTHKLTRQQRKNLLNNVEQRFAIHMTKAIEDMMGETQLTMQAMQKTTQIQALVARDIFQKKALELRDKLRNLPDGDPNKIAQTDQLSQKQYNQVLKEIAPLLAVIRMENQTVNVGSKESIGWDADTVAVSSWDQKFPLSTEVGTPSEAGVRAAPFMVIATGDGKMVLNIYDRDGGLVNSLPVFDGIEMAADKVDEQSLTINEAVTKGWLEDSTGAVADSFKGFAEAYQQFGELSLDTRKKLTRIFYPKEWFELDKAKRYITMDQLAHEIARTQNEINEISDQVQARKAVLAKVQFSVDHMATGEKAYNHKGIALPKDLQEMEDVLNDMYQDELIRIQKEKGRAYIHRKTEKPVRKVEVSAPPKTPATPPTPQEIKDGLKPAGSLLEVIRKNAAVVAKGSPVRQTTVPQLIRMLNAVRPFLMGNEQASMFRAIYKTLGNDVKVYFGPATNLHAWIKRQPEFEHLKDIEVYGNKGFYDPKTNTLFLKEASNETVLHELIHAATFAQTLRAYQNPKNTPVHTKQAIERLEKLMDEFMAPDLLIRDTNPMLDLRDTLQRIEVSNMSSESKKAHQLNEFMAWSLSNQNLIERGQSKGALAKLAEQVIEYIRDLLGYAINEYKPDDTIWSQVRFNTLIVMDEAGIQTKDAEMPLFQNSGSDDRLQNLMDRFDQRVKAHITSPKVDAQVKVQETRIDESTRAFEQLGFTFDAQQRKAFTTIQVAMSVLMDMDKLALMRAQELYRDVMSKLTVEHFMADPNSTVPGEREAAERKFIALSGNRQMAKDAHGNTVKSTFTMDLNGRSNILSNFIALSQVDPQFREILSQMTEENPQLKVPGQDGNSVLDGAGSVWEYGAEKLSSLVLGKNPKGGIISTKLDELSLALAKAELDERTWVEKSMQAGENRINDWLADRQQKDTDKAIDFLAERQNKAKNKYVRAIYAIGQAILSIMSHKHGKDQANYLTSQLNSTTKIPNIVGEFFTQLRGTTDDNYDVVSLINKVRHQVSSLRQNYREVVPQMIADNFSRRIRNREWSMLHQTIGKADLAALGSSYGITAFTKLVSDQAFLKAEIARLETEIGDGVPVGIKNRWMSKMEALSTYMMTGEVTSTNLLRNAHSIAHLYGEIGNAQQNASTIIARDKNRIAKIDQLTTLYAFQKADKDSKALLADLLEKEPKGMEFVMRYMGYLRDSELKKQDIGRGIINHYKGRLSPIKSDSSNIIVAPASDKKRLLGMGYKFIGPYKLAAQDPSDDDLGYYQSPVAGRAQFNQGAMQTVQKTLFGVDEVTGFTTGAEVAGRISSRRAAQKVHSDILMGGKRDGLTPDTYLLPVFDMTGEVVAYERSLDPKHTAKIAVNDNLSTLLGMWAGRQQEEGLASEWNKKLVGILGEKWKNEKPERRGEYVNLADPEVHKKDPVLKDIWNLIPKEMKDDIMKHFGSKFIQTDAEGNGFEVPNSFMVRKDMLNDVLGYRQASIGDFWTGMSRVNPEIQKVIKGLAETIFGKRAYEYLVRAERMIQTVVAEAKVTIVVRSGMVLFGNIVSNLIQLSMRGVPLRMMGKPAMRMIAETNQHLRNKAARARLIAQIQVNFMNKDLVKKLSAEYVSLEDADRRMSIWPLIEAGELNTISEGLEDADQALANGGAMEWIASQFDNAPDGVRNTVKNLLVTRDTNLFKFMNRGVQYGDFIAKSIHYEYMLQNGISKEDALRKLNDEYINYNRQSGRSQSYLESIGLLWFPKYKIGAMKVAASIIKENPLKAMLWGLMPSMVPGANADTVLNSNLVGVGINGNLGYSIGPAMAQNAVTGNPWFAMIFK